MNSNPRFLPRLIIHSDWNKMKLMRETLDRIDECINEDKESDRNSINLSSSYSSKEGISPMVKSTSHSQSNPFNIGWSSGGVAHPPPSFSHQFSTLRRPPSYNTEETSSRLSHEEPSSFFSYPMVQSMIHPQQSQHQQVVPYPVHNQMIPSMIPSSHPSFLPHIPYNQSIMQQSTEPQQWCPSSVPSYPLNHPQVLYFSPYTNPPSAFLPSKHDSLSDEDYDPFPSECSTLCCHGFTQLLWIILLIIFTSILGAFFLGIFSL